MVSIRKMTILPAIALAVVVTLYLSHMGFERYNRDVLKWVPETLTHVEFLRHTTLNKSALHTKKTVKIANWIKVGEDDFFIFSVFGEQSLNVSSFDSLVFVGLERAGRSNLTYKCCYKYSDGSVTSKILERKRYKFTSGNVIAAQIVCNITNRVPPDYATLVSADGYCYTDATYLSPIYRPRDPKPKLAICGKIAFGSKSSIELVEWVEFHSHHGGGPFIIYAYQDLNSDAMKVLDYYEHLGIMEKVNVPTVPLLDKFPRKMGSQTPDSDQDDQVMNFDFQQRARHFSSYSMIDTDEFLTPKLEFLNSYVQLVTYLLFVHRKAGLLKLKTEIHLKDWGKTDPNNSLIIGQYEYHTEPTPLTEKNIFFPDRIKTGTMWQHNAVPLPGYVRAYVKPNDVVLKHYRYCKRRWFLSFQRDVACRDHFKKIRGTRMGKYAKQIEDKVFNVTKMLGL